MDIVESLCCLCADDLDDPILLERCEGLTEIQKLVDHPLKLNSHICMSCFLLLSSIRKFSIQFQKTQKLFTFLLTMFDPAIELDLNELRKQYGLDLDDKADKSTESVDLSLDIKDEFMNSQALSCGDHAFNELEDFGEISTMSPPESNFVIDVEVKEEEEQTLKMQVDDNQDEDLNSKTETSSDGHINFTCHICQEELKTFYSLKNHYKREHQTNPQMTCSCGATVTSKSQILIHRKMHMTKNLFSCKFCDKIYSHQQSLQSHMRRTHPDTKNSSFLCLICPKQFDTERKLKVHNQSHLPDEKKMIHPCPYCDKRFTKSVNIQAHVRSIHQMERPFLCSECGKCFSTKGALKEHHVIHSDTYPYQCSFCPKKFKNLPRLKTHEDIHNPTQYICNICGISLNTKRTLKMHMVVHSDQKRYKCQCCGSSFKRSKALKNHLILHSGLRPYSCPFCDKTFANGSNCRSHKKKAHPAELAALEASGKVLNSAPNIPSLEQLQPKVQQV
ncbi:CLUMA_CG015854, isoform A [Clunio marinus]|uniref:CLUMA_CG015854, isoform A n=1 Tax=Clunio marinus TaxID=568069 RepID=A0A1J1IU71_9DIPT|nr:CLUMA_CG015854, isoform A [Clunio marinus]